MKKLFVLLVCAAICSCGSKEKGETVALSDFNTDFPTSEVLEFEQVQTFVSDTEELFPMMKDSILWCMNRDESAKCFGKCYDVVSGREISVVVMKGRASNEVIDLEDFYFAGDSVCFVERGKIKTMAVSDVLSNKPLGERKMQAVIFPDSILACRLTKISGNGVLAMLCPTLLSVRTADVLPINRKSLVWYKGSEIKAFDVIDYESYGLDEDNEDDAEDCAQVKMAYASGNIASNEQGKVVMSVSDQFVLYTFDLEKGEVMNEKRYTRMKYSGGSDGGMTYFDVYNDLYLEIVGIKATEKYICCLVTGFFSKEDKEAGDRKVAVFVFDWNLNPVKRFDIPKAERRFYNISEEGDCVFYMDQTDDKAVLYAAPLSI